MQAKVIVVENEKLFGKICMNSIAILFFNALNPEFKSGIFIPAK
jgi:hypothetical protein